MQSIFKSLKISRSFCQAFSILRRNPSLHFNHENNRYIFTYIRNAFNKKSEDSFNMGEETEIDSIWNETNKVVKSYKRKKDYKLSVAEEKKLMKAKFLDIVDIFMQRHGKNKRGYNEFAQRAHSEMINYGVEDDLECYKAILTVFPRGELVHSSYLMSELVQNKRQQDTLNAMILDMVRYSVMPDDDFGQQIIDIFGYRSLSMRVYRQAMYWLPKLRYQSPFPIADRLPITYDIDPAYVAQLAAHRMCPDKMTKFNSVYLDISEKVEGEPHCLVSAQSPKQQMLVSALCGGPDRSSKNPAVLFLDGPHFVFYRQLQLSYYTLWAGTHQDRLKTEFETYLKDEDLDENIQNDTWEYQLYGYNDEEDTKKIPISDLRDIHSQTYVPEHDRGKDLILLEGSDKVIVQPKRIRTLGEIMEKPVNPKVPGIVYPEPEFDNRWVALRRLHKPVYLPKRLMEVHEQVEGSILAVGVVGPTRTSLDDQKLVREFQSSIKHVEDAMKNSIDLTGIFDELPVDVPSLPVHASDALLRAWLNELRVKNPDLDNASILVRVKKDIKTKKEDFHDNRENEELATG